MAINSKRTFLKIFVNTNPYDIGVARTFDWELAKPQPMTSSEIFERGTFCGTKILQIERSEAVACV